jgi:hypothetical protein
MAETLENLKSVHDKLGILIRIVEHGISAPATTAFICSRILCILETEIKRVKPVKVSGETRELYYELEKLLNLYNYGGGM